MQKKNAVQRHSTLKKASGSKSRLEYITKYLANSVQSRRPVSVRGGEPLRPARSRARSGRAFGGFPVRCCGVGSEDSGRAFLPCGFACGRAGCHDDWSLCRKWDTRCRVHRCEGFLRYRSPIHNLHQHCCCKFFPLQHVATAKRPSVTLTRTSKE